MGVLRLLHELAPEHPQAFGHLLQALDFHLAAGARRWRWWATTASRSSAWSARASARTWCSPAASPTACRCSRAASPWTAAPPPTSASSFACQRPVTEPEELEALLA